MTSTEGSPPGWSETTLGAVADIVRGVTFEKSQAANVPSKGFVPIIRATNIERTLNLMSEMVYVPEECVKAAQRLRPGDTVIVASSGSLNVVGRSAPLLTAWEGGFGAFCAVVRPHPALNSLYLSHFVSSPVVRKRWRDRAQGTNINNLKGSDLGSTTLPVPPRAEQDRIVAVIEEAFSRIDAGVSALDATLVKASALSRATMAAAVGNWNLVPLRDVLTSLRNGVFVSRPGVEKTRRAILRISAVRPMHLDATDVRYVDDDTPLKNENAYSLEAGDLLFTRYNGNAELVGACALVGPEGAGLLHPDKLIRGIVDRDRANAEYLEIALNCGPSLRAIAQRRKTTAGQVGISGAQLLQVPVPLPPIDQQQRIVDEAHSALDGIGSLRRLVEDAKRRCERMRAAILVSAFSGALVPQNSGDEPSEILLGRIITDRASSESTRTRKTSRSLPKVTA